jgi:hypothetical protein
VCWEPFDRIRHSSDERSADSNFSDPNFRGNAPLDHRDFQGVVDHEAGDHRIEETRESFEGVVNWFPYADSPQFDSAAQVLTEGRRLLAASPNEDSVAREDLEQTIAWAEELLRTGKSGWAALREKILRQSGCLT